MKRDEEDRIEWLSIIIPMNSEETLQLETSSKKEEITQTTISLSFMEKAPTIMKPDVNQTFLAKEFINSVTEKAKQDLAVQEGDESDK